VREENKRRVEEKEQRRGRKTIDRLKLKSEVLENPF
jgi:hypothetical protein